MKSNNPIVVGIDYSECSAVALREAVRHAKRQDSKIVVVHSIDQDIFERIHRHSGLSVDEVIETSRESVENFIKETAGDDLGFLIEIQVGKPDRDILRASNYHKASLLILGQQGDFSINDETGSVAMKCAQKAHCPLLLVRKEHSGSFEKIGAAIGLSDASPKVFSDALNAAKSDDAALFAFHVFQATSDLSKEYALFSGMLLPQADSDHRAEDLEVLKRIAEEDFAGALKEVQVEYAVVDGKSVVQGIRDCVKEQEVDLLVIGNKDRGAWKKIFLGSNAEKLLRNCPCSVLLSRVD